MGSQAPYLYAPPQAGGPRYEFDPRIYTRASLVQAPPKTKQTGPLLDFNRHPDSWLVRPLGHTNRPQIGRNIKRNVKALRWVQQSLRGLELISASGLLALVIMITNTAAVDGWVIRAAPAVDLISTIYAIYHLFRAAKSRPPMSSASYHLFAFLIDLGLVPFYVYTFLDARHNSAEPWDSPNRWSSISASSPETIFLATLIIAMVSVGLHTISSCISICLFILFRSIANLPPDMNPLLDNLTSRSSHKQKHKHKSSNASMVKPLMRMSASTLSNDFSMDHSNRDSLIKENDTTRPVSFLQTRQKTNSLYSPPKSHGINASISAVDGTATISNPDMYTYDDLSAYSPPIPRKSSKRESYPSSSENWYVHDDEDDEGDVPPMVLNGIKQTEQVTVEHIGDGSLKPVLGHEATTDERLHFGTVQQNKTVSPLQPVRQIESISGPLTMNPPTPRPSISDRDDDAPVQVKNHELSVDSRGGSGGVTKQKSYGKLQDVSGNIPRRTPGLRPAPETDWLGSVERNLFEDNRGRVVSSSGVELIDSSEANEHDNFGGYANIGRRNVSGKVVEEGRAGYGNFQDGHWWGTKQDNQRENWGGTG